MASFLPKEVLFTDEKISSDLTPHKDTCISKSSKKRAGLLAASLTVMMAMLALSTFLTLASLKDIMLDVHEMHLDVRTATLKAEAVFMLRNPSAVHQVTARSVACDVLAADVGGAHPAPPRLLGTLTTSPNFEPRPGAEMYPTTLENSDGMVLADIVAGRMDKVQLTFKCHMDTTVRVWYLIPVDQPMNGEFSFGEGSDAASIAQETANTKSDADLWRVSPRNTWPRIRNLNSAGVQTELQFTFLEGHSMQVLFGSLLNYTKQFTIWLPEMDYSLSMDVNAARRTSTNSTEVRTAVELKHLRMRASSQHVRSSEVTQSHGAVRITLPVKMDVSCPLHNGCLSNLPSVLSNLPSWKPAGRAALLDSIGSGRGLLQSVIADYKWVEDDVEVDVLGVGINAYARLRANDFGFMAMAFGEVLDYNFDFDMSVDYNMQSSSYAPDELFEFLRSAGIYNSQYAYYDPYRQLSKFDNYFFQFYGVRVRLYMEAFLDEHWDWYTDWDKPTSAILGEMICDMDNVMNGLYNTGYYLIAKFEDEAFSGYAGYRDKQADDAGFNLWYQGFTDIRLAGNASELGGSESGSESNWYWGPQQDSDSNWQLGHPSTASNYEELDSNSASHSVWMSQASGYNFTLMGDFEGTSMYMVGNATESESEALEYQFNTDVVLDEDDAAVSLVLRELSRDHYQVMGHVHETMFDALTNAFGTLSLRTTSEPMLEMSLTNDDETFTAGGSWTETVGIKDTYSLYAHWDSHYTAAFTVSAADGLHVDGHVADDGAMQNMFLHAEEGTEKDNWNVVAMMDIYGGVHFNASLHAAGPKYGAASSLTVDGSQIYSLEGVFDDGGENSYSADASMVVDGYQLSAGGTLTWEDTYKAVFETAANVTVHFGMDYDQSPCFLHMKLNNGFNKDMEGLGIWTAFTLQDEMESVFYENLNVVWTDNNVGQTVLDASLDMYLGEQQEMFRMQDSLHIGNMDFDPIDMSLDVSVSGELLSLESMDLSAQMIQRTDVEDVNLRLRFDMLGEEEDAEDAYAVKFETVMHMDTRKHKEASNMTMYLWQGDQPEFKRRVNNRKSADFSMSTMWSADRATTSSIAGMTPKDFAMTTKVYLDSETSGMQTSFVMDGDAFDMAMSIVDNGDDAMSMNTCGKMAETGGMIDFDMNMGVQMKDEGDNSHSEMSMTFQLKEVYARYGNAMFGEMTMDWNADSTLMGIDTPDGVMGRRNMTLDMAMPSAFVRDMDLDFDSMFMHVVTTNSMDGSQDTETTDTTLEDFYYFQGMDSNSNMPDIFGASSCTAEIVDTEVYYEAFFPTLQLDTLAEEQAFKQEYISTVSLALGVPEESVNILALIKGSVRVESKITFMEAASAKEFKTTVIPQPEASSSLFSESFKQTYGTPQLVTMTEPLSSPPSSPQDTRAPPEESLPPFPPQQNLGESNVDTGAAVQRESHMLISMIVVALVLCYT